MGRRPEDLHPYLLESFEKSKAEYLLKFPEGPEPFLTQTYRPAAEQEAFYAQGRRSIDEVNRLRSLADLPRITKSDNKIITHARPGQSLHGYKPAFAYDIAFKKKDGSVDWSYTPFVRFAAIAKKDPLVEWGGDWKKPKTDNPHFQFRDFTYHMAKAGVDPLKKNNA